MYVYLSLSLFCGKKSGLRAGPIPSGVPACLSGLNVDTSALRAHTLDGGGQKSPRYQGPPGCLPGRRRGGPWAPPPRCVDPQNVSFFCSAVWLVQVLYAGYVVTGNALGDLSGNALKKRAVFASKIQKTPEK